MHQELDEARKLARCLPVRLVHKITPVAEDGQVQGNEAEDKGAPAGEPAVRQVMLRDLQRRDVYVHSRDSRAFDGVSHAGCKQANIMSRFEQISAPSADS